MNASEPQPPSLTKRSEHCACSTDDERAPATLRLRQALGEELARLLLDALARDHRRAGLCAKPS
jgi:hypothetical protein